jgi:UDP-glucuronate decarboxylase
MMMMINPIVAEDLRCIHAEIGNRKKLNGTVVITGCAGFLGYYFLQYLVRFADQLGVHKVIGLDTFLLGKPRWLHELAAEFPDVLSSRKFDLSRCGIEIIDGVAAANFVIHMASIASPTFYRHHPLETIAGNVWGLRRLLDYFKESTTLQGFLFFSSSEIYGDPEPAAIPTNEEYRGNVSCIGPRACYDESKRFGETLCYVFAKKYAMPITIARPFNNYGPGMRLDDRRLPADFAKSVVEGRDIVILSNGSPTRTFCYVSDAIVGYLQCLLHGGFDYFNIGIERPEIKICELGDLYRRAGREIFGYGGYVRYEKSSDAEYLTDNPKRRCPDISKARRILNYSPKIYVDEGVRRYLKFLKYGDSKW